jgi:hypothetical protein
MMRVPQNRFFTNYDILFLEMSENNTEVSAILNAGSPQYSKSKSNPLGKEKLLEANKRMNQSSVNDTIRYMSFVFVLIVMISILSPLGKGHVGQNINLI